MSSIRLYSDSTNDKEIERQVSQPQQSPNELSSLAKSVRDKIAHLLDSFHEELATNRIPIVVSVSGGCDSVALFHALVEWKDHLIQQEHGLQLDITVVHFHHRQRPTEADEDCKLVKELVEEHNRNSKEHEIRFRLEDWKSINDAETTETTTEGSSLSFSQDKARVWRRNKLLECAQDRLENLSNSNGSIPFGIVLTAHHDDDSYETVLIKLLRGVHLLNLHDKATISSIALLQDAATETQQPPNPPIYLVRPFVTDSQPLLHDTTATTNTLPGHSKDELIQYLVDRNLEWREDASNHDPNSKYLRNRVRNELIPLLQDLTEDSFRTKRIPALLEQSQELKDDLQPRVQEYLQSVVERDDSQSYFTILPFDSDDSSSSKLIRSQALYQWMSSCVADDGWNIPYESHQRVIQQLENFSDRTAWTLELGSGRSVKRIGNVLKLQHESDTTDPNSCWEWKPVKTNNTELESKDALRIQVPSTVLESLSSSSVQFVSTTLREAEVGSGSEPPEMPPAIRFSPPWRNSSIKLRAFLRGQKVPTHLRDDAQLLFLVPNEEQHIEARRLIAVRVRDAWIVDKEFYIEEKTIVSDNSIVLQLESRI